MSVVVHRIVVPCERMAQVPFPHTAVEDSEEEADEHCDIFDTEEGWIRHPSVGVHAVEEQRTPVGTPLSLSNQDTFLSQPTPVQRRHERPSAATSSVSWKQWTPAEVANFVRGLTSDFGEKANVYAETLFKEDIDGDVLANLSPGNLKELGLSLSDSFKLLQRFQEGLSTVRHMQAETEELTQVPQIMHSPAQTPVLHSLNRPSAVKGAGPMSTAAAGEARLGWLERTAFSIACPGWRSSFPVSALNRAQLPDGFPQTLCPTDRSHIR
jgi:hypothetical protein